MDIVQKIKKEKLTGRGGAGFPADVKWEMVAKTLSEMKYVVANGSEGEPGIKKDEYILEHYPEKLIDGMSLALSYLEGGGKIKVKGFLYLNKEYYSKYAKKLIEIIGSKAIEVFKKPKIAGYIGGEETTVLNTIEGKISAPRLRPPFPTLNGLWGKPTLVNNIETFYDVSLIESGEYKKTRFYTVNGDIHNNGVYEFDEKMNIEDVLKRTDNYPEFDFFVQVGGGGSGEVLNSKQLKRPVSGAGSITVYSITKHNPIELIQEWVYFFQTESCGQCTPCREGTYRLREILSSQVKNWELFKDILQNLRDSSFCGLGCAVPVPIVSYVNNVLKENGKKFLNFSDFDRDQICSCF